jgi:hypothetical protein
MSSIDPMEDTRNLDPDRIQPLQNDLLAVGVGKVVDEAGVDRLLESAASD